MVGTKKKKVIKLDRYLAEQVDLAREALQPIADNEEIGDYVGCVAEGERLVTHAFACLKPGYVGWNWVSTLTRVMRAKNATICEIDLIPGENALLAPRWIPWAERLEPGDNRREDTLPYIADDPRLEVTSRDSLEVVKKSSTLDETDFQRPRVLSSRGRAEAAKRWYESTQGPLRNNGRRLRRPDHTCLDCGFMLKISGSMQGMFGVCANGWSPDDGKVVSLDHVCGAHSETDLKLDNSQWESPPNRLDENDLEIISLK